jgi:hypothetical protein
VVDAVIARVHSIRRRASSNIAEPLVADRGMTRALPFSMSATATIEEINGEQIATRTDLLLMRARAARVRLSSNKLAFANDVHVARARRSQRTMVIRVRRAGTSTTSAAILASVFAIAIVITSLL